MKPHAAIAVVLTTCILGIACFGAPRGTAKTTDTSDAWYVHTESGWGILLVSP